MNYLFASTLYNTHNIRNARRYCSESEEIYSYGITLLLLDKHLSSSSTFVVHAVLNDAYIRHSLIHFS